MNDSPVLHRLVYTNDRVDRVNSVELLESGIRLTRANQPARFVAYGDIALVRLRYTPVRGLPEYYVCTIEPRSGPPLRFGSLSQDGGFPNGYVLVPYRSFVQALHERILAAGGRPQFWAGDTSGRFALRLLGAVVAFCVAVGVIIADKRLPGWALILVAIAFAAYGWPLIRELRANETRRYNPRAIPDNLLPQDRA